MSGCRPEQARAIVDLLCEIDTAGPMLCKLQRAERALVRPARLNKLTPEQVEFIRARAHLPVVQVRAAMLEAFGAAPCATTMARVFHRLGLPTGRKPRKLTAELVGFIKAQAGRPWREVVDLVHARFGLTISSGTVYKAWNAP